MLKILVGCAPDNKTAVEKTCAPLFDAIGQATVWLGDVGKASRFKLVRASSGGHGRHDMDNGGAGKCEGMRWHAQREVASVLGFWADGMRGRSARHK